VLEQVVQELVEPAPVPTQPLVSAQIAAKQLFDGTITASTLKSMVPERYRLGIEVFDFRKKGAKYAKLRFDVDACQRRAREYIGD
jgi:hypothetical protein